MRGTAPRRLRMQARTTFRGLAAAGLVALAATGCSEDTTGGSDEPTVIEVVVSGDEVTVDGGDPGQRIEVGAGDPIDIEVTADEAGEIHLHTSNEQTLTFDEGTETLKIQIDRPGVVEAEFHDPDLLLFQLEVR